MKTFCLATIIGVLLISGGVIFDLCIEDFSEKMLEMLEEEILSDVKVADTEEIEKFLDGKRLLLASIINHDHIDEIESCITELGAYLKEKKIDEAMVRCEKLKLLLGRLPDEYGVSAENIL